MYVLDFNIYNIVFWNWKWLLFINFKIKCVCFFIDNVLKLVNDWVNCFLFLINFDLVNFLRGCNVIFVLWFLILLIIWWIIFIVLKYCFKLIKFFM